MSPRASVQDTPSREKIQQLGIFYKDYSNFILNLASIHSKFIVACASHVFRKQFCYLPLLCGLPFSPGIAFQLYNVASDSMILKN